MRTATAIASAALKLPARGRARVASQLLRSLPPTATSAAEIREELGDWVAAGREWEMETGRVRPHSRAEVMAAARRALP